MEKMKIKHFEIKDLDEYDDYDEYLKKMRFKDIQEMFLPCQVCTEKEMPCSECYYVKVMFKNPFYEVVVEEKINKTEKIKKDMLIRNLYI